jgi:hypothetical protein
MLEVGVPFYIARNGDIQLFHHPEREIDGHTTCIVGEPVRYIPF